MCLSSVTLYVQWLCLSFVFVGLFGPNLSNLFKLAQASLEGSEIVEFKRFRSWLGQTTNQTLTLIDQCLVQILLVSVVMSVCLSVCLRICVCLNFLSLCRLPIETPGGEPLYADATVTGKKREAVLACATEACRMLDAAGLLRQSSHGGYPAFLMQVNWM